MSYRRNSKRSRRRQKPPFKRFKDHCRLFIAFMFSNVGIILLVIFYTIGGALIFKTIEVTEFRKDKSARPQKYVEHNLTEEYLKSIWTETVKNSFYDSWDYQSRIDDILRNLQRDIFRKESTKDMRNVEEQWNIFGAILYSLTVITTIGYGNITPQSDWGKLVTILYALLGMPLFLLYLSNIGDLLAKSFKWIYSKFCLCRICPGVAKRRILRERRKERRLARALRKMKERREGSSSSFSISNQHSNSSSSQSYSTSSSEYDDTSSSTQATRDIEKYEEDSDFSDIELELSGASEEITVPLTVSIIIMISYILCGAILFGTWEKWDYLNGSYFCLISLSSIGFGDLVPGTNAKDGKDNVSFILCAVYLLLGMAVIAMCFNLMQEQVIHNMRAVKRAFKSCFRCKR